MGLGLALAYELVPAALGRQSFSRARMHLRVVDVSGRPASRPQLMVRTLVLVVPLLAAFILTSTFLGTWVSLIPFALLLALPAGLWMSMARSQQHQAWHDRIAGTMVVTPR